MKLLPSFPMTHDALQTRLMRFAAIFVIVYAVILSLSQAVRLYSWNVSYRWEHWLGVVVWLVGFYFLDRIIRKAIPSRDPYLLPIIALLTGWGLMTIWRLNVNLGLRQTLWLALSIGLISIGLRFPQILELLRRYKYVWLVGMLLIAALTLFIGTFPGGDGPKLWLGCCGIYVQPSEFLKLFLVVYLAAFFSNPHIRSLNLLQKVIPTLALIGAAVVLLILQRDLGTATLFIILFTAIVYLATGRREVLILSLIFLVVASVLGYKYLDIIHLRISTWLNPQLDPSGQSYQIMQSLMAVGAGGLIGSGPGLGSPGVVPVAVSDFIFSAIVEESGLFGAISLLLLMGLLAFRGLKIALSVSNDYLRFLAAGLSLFLFAQGLLIIGGNIGMLPLTGVTLPFISYGGSSLVSAFLAFLLLLQISSHTEEEPPTITPTHSYRVVGGGIVIGLAIAALFLGWIIVIQSQSLATRNDNPRRPIADRYVPRGAILDRKNQPLAVTIGNPGEYIRQVTYPDLGNTIGYSHPLFTQGGLEASLDSYLRGLRGNPSSWVWSTQLVYSHPPPGLDVRLSLDLDLQIAADDILGDHAGALILLNADSGEILALASHPTFDPNQMDVLWDTYQHDSGAPLMNRATQGLYPAGTAMGVFLLADSGSQISLNSSPLELIHSTSNRTLDCSIPMSGTISWGTAIAAGCPGAVAQLAEINGSESILSLVKRLGFLDAPDFELQTAPPQIPSTLSTPVDFIDNPSVMKISLLQMAMAAASLQNQGVQPAPRLTISVESGNQGWVALPVGPTSQTYSSAGLSRITRALQAGSFPIWETVASTSSSDEPVSWFIAGTLPEWTGTPFTLVMAIEEENPLLVQQLGLEYLKLILKY